MEVGCEMKRTLPRSISPQTDVMVQSDRGFDWCQLSFETNQLVPTYARDIDGVESSSGCPTSIQKWHIGQCSDFSVSTRGVKRKRTNREYGDLLEIVSTQRQNFFFVLDLAELICFYFCCDRRPCLIPSLAPGLAMWK